MKLSCAMIVRDSEDTLERALKSVRPHVDELVIVDTGSEDRTLGVASKYADTLVGYLWQDHFGNARQHAHDLCTGDWVMHLDADDELVNGGNLRSLMGGASSGVEAYLLRYQLMEANGATGVDFWRERVVKRDSYRWTGRIHEVLVPTHDAPYERWRHAHVVHHGSGDPIAKMRRNIRLLEIAREEAPEEPRTLFYLGRDLVSIGEPERGRKVLEDYLLVSSWPDEAYIARQLIGDCLRAAGDIGEAYRSDLLLLDIKPLWPQGYYALAQDCYYLGKFAESVHFSDIAQRLPMPDTNLFVNHEFLGSGWQIYQAVSLYRCGRLDDAAKVTADALARNPDHPQHKFNAAYFAAKMNGNGLVAAAARTKG